MTSTRRIPGPTRLQPVPDRLEQLSQTASELAQLVEQLQADLASTVQQLTATESDKAASVPGLMTVLEAGRYLGVSRMTVYRLISDGLPTIKLGTATRVRFSDLQALVEANAQVAS